jgi:GTPase-associated protein 1, N-terminal domain type 2
MFPTRPNSSRPLSKFPCFGFCHKFVQTYLPGAKQVCRKTLLKFWKSHPRQTMPQQLIYTSAPRGIVAGRSGHCTVARSALMREALMLQLEKFCYYQHLSLSGGQERPIFSCRIADIRGTRFHVLSRIQDAGLDFTGRTNFIAHHLVFTPEEIRHFPIPPVILRDWPGWVKSWTKEPQLLENEDWTALTALAGKTNVPAQTWQRITGDGVNGYGLLETRTGSSFRVDDQTDETVLKLIAESLELSEVRDTRRDFRTAAWNYTFTTSMQEQDNPADFRWRCIHSDNPAANRFATPDCRALSAVRATKVTVEEMAFARAGRQAPQFVTEPQDSHIAEGELAHFTAKAEGVPSPIYQWFSVDRSNNGQILPGETKPELIVQNPALGIARYVVSVTNSAGNAQSRVVTLSVDKKLKLAQVKSDAGTRTAARGVSYQKTEEDIERQRRRLEAEKAQKIFQNRLRRNKILVTILTIVLITSVLAAVIILRGRKPPSIISQPTIQTNQDGNICINVTADGKPPITFDWCRNNQLISSTTNCTLSLTDVSLMNSGSFFVIITNTVGAVTSAVVQWQGKPPTITQQPFFQTNSGSVRITISAIGANPLTYEWYKDDQPILSASNSSLVLTNSGSFSVIITNMAGAATSAVVQWKAHSNQLILADPGDFPRHGNNTAGGQTNHPNGTHP